MEQPLSQLVRGAIGAAIAMVLLVPMAAQAQAPAPAVSAQRTTDDGVFTVHRQERRLLFEIPDAMLGRDMLIMSRIAKAQDGLADGGANMAPNIVVRWERREGRIVLRGVSYSRTADDGTPLALAVENSNFAPVLASLPIQATGSGTSTVDVTDLYLGDTPMFTLPRARRNSACCRASCDGYWTGA